MIEMTYQKPHSLWRSSSHNCGSRDLRHNELQDRYKMKHNGWTSNGCTDRHQKPHRCADAPQTPNIWGVSPQHMQITPRTYRDHTNAWGCWTYGEHQNTWGVQTEGGSPHPHITTRNPLEHIDAQGSIGDIWEVFGYMGALGGVQMYEASKYIGGVQMAQV